MPKSVFVLICFFAACSAPPSRPVLQEGTWTGGLTPMNHPDMVLPLTYEVRRIHGKLSITLNNEGIQTPTRNLAIEGDTLSFVFNEPEENVELTCAFARRTDASYAGRCTDAEGKWAHFTMTPPGEQAGRR